MSIEAGPSQRVKPKFCDFTGYPAIYKHKTAGVKVEAEGGLRFTELWHFQDIEKMQNNRIEEILAQRKIVAGVK